MATRRCLRSLRRSGAVVVVMVAATTAGAGTWSQLPDAVTRLSRNPGDRGAGAVMAAAESAVLGEAAAGHLSVVAALMDAYAGIVSQLPDGADRIDGLARRTAGALVAYGASCAARDPNEAGRAWALAAANDPDGEAHTRLRELLIPPVAPQPGQVWTSAVNGSQLVWVPPLRFIMGCTQGDRDCQHDEIYLRWVEVPGVWVERTEVSNRMYRGCVEAGACSPPSEDYGYSDPARGDEPVAGVSWYQAREYAEWLGRRLPSEAEWERCARGKRSDTRFAWGDPRLRGLANLSGKIGLDLFSGVARVGAFPPTGWGHFDLAGNVGEWCEDSYLEVLTGAPRDGRPWSGSSWGKVIRGGSWRRTLELARVSARTWQEPAYVADDLGFRCVSDSSGGDSTERLLALAARVFPLLDPAGRALATADLVAEDRRYLEGRAVTWLVLEGRPWEALPLALALLDRDAEDPVALDLLARLEAQLLRSAASGDLERLGEQAETYRAALTEAGLLPERRTVLEKELLRTLEARARALLQQGEPRRAADYLRIALSLQPGDPKLVNLLRSASPTAGAPMSWPGDGRSMVWIPPGSFQMGRSRDDDLAGLDEQPTHTVWVEGFWLDRNEVTNADYRRCVVAGACTPPHAPETFGDPALADHPVLAVDWLQAKQYARWAGKRLPSEAEWERAARAGTNTRFPWGDEWAMTGGNAYGIREPDHWPASSPVSSFAPNPWGLNDLFGNAWEWVEDIYHSDYHDSPRDGRAWVQVSGGPAELQRVLRGGSLSSFPPKLRVSQRDHRPSEEWSRTTGFRCAASEGKGAR
jgi:formylglycine-generating enzyme required for sulfatase activity